MNRKIITLLFAIALTIAFTTITVAGNFFPAGMIWKEVHCEPDYAPLDTTYSFLYEIGEDTIVRSITCKRVLLNKTPLNRWIHEDGSKVWLLTDDYPEPIMIYDFDWHGDAPVYYEYLTGESSLIKERTYLDVNGIQEIWLGGKQMEFIMNDSGAIIKDIGRVSELYRGCCLLGYKIEEPILPGIIYSKVLWIVRDGDEIFRSESAEEWITTIPHDDIFDDGDIDGSGIVDVEDVNAAINIILKLKSVSDYPGKGDIDGNGIIDVEDVNAIINIILKL